ncbi:MAG: hypothetical protein RBS78_03410, partial [Coriobacteriia bacterium]|nr:hypothetical protein [Coriobacteriia bacterium]
KAKDDVSGFVAGLTGDMDAIERLDPSQFPIMNIGIDLRRSLDGLIEWLQPTIEMVKDAFGSLGEAAGPALADIRDGLASLLPVLELAGAAIGIAIVIAIQAAALAINVLSAAIGPLAQMFSGLAAFIGGTAEIIMAIFTGRWQDAWDAAEAAGQGVVDFIIGAVRLILEPIERIVEGAVESFEWLYDKLVGHSIVPDIVNGIVRWFTGLPGKIAGSLSRFVSDVSAKFTEAYNRMRDTLSASAVGRVFRALFDAVASIPRRFSEMRDAVVRTIRDLIAKLRKPIDDAVGVISRLNPFMRHSPSLVDNVLAGTRAIREAYESVSGIRLDRPEFIGSLAYAPSFAPAGALASGAGGITNNYYLGDTKIPAGDPEAQSVMGGFVRLVRRYQRMGPTGG